jgi:peptidoglycan hydrolase CwlO-like protein
MRKFLALSLILISYILGAIVFSPRAYSDELDDLNSKINDLQKQLSESQKATKPLESQLTSIQSQMKDIENRVTTIETDLAVKKKSIDAGYKELEAQQELLNQSIRNLYMRNYAFSPILIFVSNDNASSITKTLVYQKKGADKDKALITNTALRIADLEQKQKELEEEQKKLAAVKQKLDSQRAEVAKVVQGAKDYQATLSKQIAELSAKQQALLAQKLSSLNIPTSAYTTQGGCVDDRNVDPGFSPRFAFFTFGVPNRVGLNQYGAKGRAEAGQSAESILSAYYSADLNKSYDTGINIHVVGTNEYGQSFDTNWNIEDYVKHIYEMPTNWNMEALKAQAVAARSYALATTNNGANTICPSQSCQVVKQEENSDSWKQAVDATRGWVLTSGGSPIRAWFSSTRGG